MPNGLTMLIISYFRGRLKFTKVFLITIVSQLTRFIFCSFALFVGLGLRGVVISLVLSQLITFIFALSLVMIKRISNTTFHGGILKMALPYWGLGILAFLMRRVDIFCIKYFLSDYAQVAYYSSASRIVEVLIQFLFIPSAALLPVLSSLMHNKEFTKSQMVLENYIRYTFLLSVPLCLWLSINNKEIMSTIFSYKFVSGGSVLSIFSVSWIFISLLHVLNTTILATRRTWILLKFNIGTFFINLILNIILIPRYGIIGAAIATVTASLCFGIGILLYAYRENILPIKKLIWLDKMTIFRVFAIVLILGVLNDYLKLPQNWRILVFRTIFFSILYFLLLFISKEINKEDWGILVALKSKILRKVTIIK